MNGLHSRSHRAQSGLTLVELMVAMVIGLILLAGLVTVFASMSRSFATTQALDQLVNQQRFASTVLTNAVSTAGYYPLGNRTVRGQYPDAQVAFPVATITIGGQALKFSTAGQVVYGTGGISPGSNDVVAVRILQDSGTSSPFDCLGHVPTAATASIAISVFWVDTTKNELRCATSNDPGGAALVGGDLLKGPGIPASPAKYGGVSSLIAEYGVDTTGDGSIDRFMSANTINSAAGKVCPDVASGTGNSSSCWPYVRSIRLSLAFISKLNRGQAPLPLTRTVVLNNTDGKTRAPNLGN